MSGFVILVYGTVNEEQRHDPKLRSTMWVTEISYTFESIFPHKKKLQNRMHVDLLLKLSLGRPKMKDKVKL